MSEKPRPKFWQFHLSTAIVSLMFVGVVVYLNCVPTRKYADLVEYILHFPDGPAFIINMNPADAKERRQYLLEETFGFPWTVWRHGCRVTAQGKEWVREPASSIKQLLAEINQIEQTHDPNHTHGFDRGDIFEWDLGEKNWQFYMTGDVLLGLVSLIVIVLGFESYVRSVRRREARKT